MTLEQLKVFLAVYDTGSLTVVANANDTATSSISRSVSSLEKELGFRLFHRTTRRLSPTQEGALYYQKISPLIDELDQAAVQIKDASQTPSGVLRVTVSNSFGELILVPRLADFLDQYPNIEFEMILSDRRVDLVEERIDLAVRHGALEDSSMVARKLIDVRYVLVASPAYVSECPKIMRPEDLEHARLLTFLISGFDRLWSFQLDGEHISVPIRPVLALSSGAALLRAVSEGMGVAMLPDWMVKQALEAGQLQLVLPEWECVGAASGAAIQMLLPSRAFLPAKTRAFADYLVKLTSTIA